MDIYIVQSISFSLVCMFSLSAFSFSSLILLPFSPIFLARNLRNLSRFLPVIFFRSFLSGTKSPRARFDNIYIRGIAREKDSNLILRYCKYSFPSIAWRVNGSRNPCKSVFRDDPNVSLHSHLISGLSSFVMTFSSHRPQYIPMVYSLHNFFLL